MVLARSCAACGSPRGKRARFVEAGARICQGRAAVTRDRKPRQVVGHMVDMRRVAPFHLPVLAEDFARAFRHHQHRGHAERVRHLQVARKVLEHRGARRIDAVAGEEAVVGLRQRFRLELGRDDVEHVLEMLVDGEPPHHRVGVLARAVGENELAAGQPLDRGAERRDWARAANGRSGGRNRESRPASSRARSSARASRCRSACSNPSAAGTPRRGRLEKSAM